MAVTAAVADDELDAVNDADADAPTVSVAVAVPVSDVPNDGENDSV